MKQFGIGILVLIAAAICGAVFVVAGPPRLSAPTPAAQMTLGPALGPALPRGKGFDFYVLALSWSPTYCQDSQARQRDVTQCSGPRPFAFVVHGLWPQFEQGYPRACQTSRNRPSQTEARAMLDIMPSARLVQHQWDNHGACSGLSSQDYLTLVRAAAARVRIPDTYMSAPDWRRVTAGDVEAAFVAANAGLDDTGIAIAQRGKNLSEVRICLTLDLAPRACPEVDQQGVNPQTRLSLPPARA